jgi:hypothetical protein
MGFTYPIPDRWRMCTISYSIPRWRTAISCGQCSNMLEYDLLRRNASTNDRKTDLIERYILHRKPKHTIYVRYFSLLLYLLNVQVAPPDNKTSLKLWWRIILNVLSWQDSETRPGEFVRFRYFELSPVCLICLFIYFELSPVCLMCLVLYFELSPCVWCVCLYIFFTGIAQNIRTDTPNISKYLNRHTIHTGIAQNI